MMSFGQSKKKQIEALNFSLYSLNTLLSNTRTNSAKESKEINNSINSLYKEKEKLNKKIDILNYSLDSINNVLSITRENSNNEASKEEKQIVQFDDQIVLETIKLISNKTGIDILYTDIFQKEIINGETLIEFDFTNLTPQMLSQYNLISPSGLKTILCYNSNSKFKHLKFERSCCPGDNEECLILPANENFVSMLHYYGMFGGNYKVFFNNKETNSIDYEKDFGENGFFLNYE